MPIWREAEVKELFGVPDELAVAALLALGHPVRQPRRLTRTPVEDFTTVDHAAGPPFTPQVPL
jgi:nitroreductase